MLTWLHKFHTAKTDGPDSTLVKPSDWNAQHDAKTDLDGVILGRPAGSGPGDIQDIPILTAINLIIPAGMLMPYAGIAVPAGWFACDGSLKNRLTEARLFAAIGTTFSAGDGSTTFGLPDLRGRVPTGVDAGAGRLPGWTLGVAGGASVSATGNIHSTGYALNNLGNLALAGAYVQYWSSYSYVVGGGGVQVGDGSAVGTISGGYIPFNYNLYSAVDGSSGNFNIVQPTIALNYVIKA